MSGDREGLLPFLTVDGAVRAIEFYRTAFAAVEISRSCVPDGRVIYAELQIASTTILLADAFPERGSNPAPTMLGGTTVTLHIRTADPDGLFHRAVAAGATPLIPVQDMFWGQRFRKVLDPFGHRWALCTPLRPVDPEELATEFRKHFL